MGEELGDGRGGVGVEDRLVESVDSEDCVGVEEREGMAGVDVEEGEGLRECVGEAVRD